MKFFDKLDAEFLAEGVKKHSINRKKAIEHAIDLRNAAFAKEPEEGEDDALYFRYRTMNNMKGVIMEGYLGNKAPTDERRPEGAVMSEVGQSVLDRALRQIE